MFYATRIQKAGDGRILDEKGKELRMLGHMPVADGDIVFNDGQHIFGDTFEGTQLTSFKKPGIPVLGALDDGEMRGYFKRNSKYKEYRIAEGNYIVNGQKKYFHADGTQYLDAEIAMPSKEEVGHYAARTTGEREYEATLVGGDVSDDANNELILTVTEAEGSPQEICRMSLQKLLPDIIEWAQEKTSDFATMYDDFCDTTRLKLFFEPEIVLKAKINNLKMSPQRDIEMLYSAAGDGAIHINTNYEELSNEIYSRAEFFNTDFAFEHEENGGHPQLKEALIALWDYWLCKDISSARQIEVDIYSESADQIHAYEVAEYKAVDIEEMIQADESDTASYLELGAMPLEASYLTHTNHAGTGEAIAATLPAEQLISNKTNLHRAEKISYATIDDGQIQMSRLITNPYASGVVDYEAFVAFYDNGSVSTVPLVYGYVYTAWNVETRYREIPSPVMSVRILPILSNGNFDFSDYQPISSSTPTDQSERSDSKLAMISRGDVGGGNIFIGRVPPEDIEQYRVGTGFVFFEGAPSVTYQGICPLNDEYAWKFIIRENNPVNDGYKHEHEVLLCLNGDYAYASELGSPLEETEHQNEFSFPVQGKYRAKYRRIGNAEPVEDVIEAEEKAWSMTGIFDSGTRISGAVPTQYDRQLKEIPSIDYNVSLSSLGKNAANGYLVGVNDGKLYRYNAEDGFEEVGSELKNFRLREMKRISKARK